MKKPFILALLLSIGAIAVAPQKSAAQYIQPETCSPLTGFDRSYIQWQNGWCVNFTASDLGQSLFISTITSNNSIFVLAKGLSANGVGLYKIRIGRNGQDIVEFTTDRFGDITNIQGSPRAIQTYMPEIRAAINIAEQYTLPIQGNPFTSAIIPPDGNCAVIDGYVQIGVESPAFDDPAEISGNQIGSRVNMRTGPGTEYDVDAYGLVGDSVTVIGQAFSTECETWAKVKFPESGYEGWMHSRFIELEYGRGWWD